MIILLKAGTTSRRERVFIQDTTSPSGGGLTGLTSASGGLIWSYVRSDQTTVTSVAMSAGTLGTWSSGGVVEVDHTLSPGLYEIGIPNAAIVSGNTVEMQLFGAANMATCPIKYVLSAIDTQSPTFNLTLAKGTNLTGFNDIPATAIVTGGAVNTSAGKAAVTLNAVDVTGNLPGADTAGTGTLLTRLSSGRATNLDNLDAAISSRSTYAGGAVASVTGNVGGSVGSVTGNVGGNVVGSVGSVLAAVVLPANPPSGFLITASYNTAPTWFTGGGGGSAPTVVQIRQEMDTNSVKLANLDATISSRSTYAGADTAGTGTLLTRLTSGRATNLDNLDAAVSTRSVYAGGAVASVTGAVGSVTGSVGSVVGSVGSVTGNVGGNVAGNVAGTVASVTGSVGSVTGNVGGNLNGNVVGSVGSVTGAVTLPANPPSGFLVTASYGTAPAWNVAPDNADILLIKAKTDNLPSGFPANFPSLGISPAGKINEVVLVDTVTTLTGHTPQSGDNYARIGVAGVGLTNLGDARLAHLDANVSATATASNLTALATTVTTIATSVGSGLNTAVAAIGVQTAKLGFTGSGPYAVNSTVANYASGQDPGTIVAAFDIENSYSIQAALQAIASFAAGNIVEAADHSLTTFAAAGATNGGTTRLVATNTATTRTVVQH